MPQTELNNDIFVGAIAARGKCLATLMLRHAS